MTVTDTANSQLEIYEQMARFSNNMARAAEANDWDELISLEERVSNLRNLLIRQGEVTLSADDQVRKKQLIGQILADDAEVRRHTEPWMEQVRRFLGTGNQQRRIERAYGAAG